MLVSILEQYGLSEKEAKIYLAGLSLGTAPGSTIARHAEEHRVTTYSILKELIKEGIFTSVTQRGITYFTATPPQQLAKNLEDKYAKFSDALPQLLAISEKALHKPKVQFFEGREGMKRMYDDMLTTEGDTIYSFLGSQETDRHLTHYLNTIFVPQRVANNIEAQVLCDHTLANQSYLEQNKENLTTIKFINTEDFSLFCGIDIYGNNKVILSSFAQNEMSGMIITSQKIHDTLKNIFNLIRKTH